MPRTLADARRWMQQGAVLVSDALARLDDAALAAPTDLDGWTRAHVVAHLSANAEAVGRLVHWAATGEETPMYASMQQRAADIEAGSLLAGAELRAWFARSDAQLDADMDALTSEQWTSDVVTAQGRTVPASETPWMRSREVMVHAVDLGAGVGFSDLPADFLAALCEDIVGKRGSGDGPAIALAATDTDGRWVIAGAGDLVTVTGTLPDITAYLAGRRNAGVTAGDGSPAPALPAWL